MNVIVILFWCG